MEKPQLPCHASYGILAGMMHDVATSPQRRPTFADYGDTYFTALYGAVPRQTVVDVARDRLIRTLVQRYVEGGRLVEIGCG